MFDRKVILASQSPRRKFLLEEAGYNVEVITIDVEESYPETLALADVPVFLAEKKANAVQVNDYRDAPLLTADTVVIHDSRILGKPNDKQEAKNFLSVMSGKSHTVITGVAIRHNDTEHKFGVKSLVHFDQINDEEIEYYLEMHKPYDKAGAYGIQDWIGWCKISKIEGSYSNIMGLPMREVYQTLKKLY